MRRTTRAHLLFTLALLLVGGCASGQAGRPASDPDRLTQDELADFQRGSVLDAIQRLRPRWLRARGAGSFRSSQGDFAAVVIDDQPAADWGALRTLDVEDVDRIIYLSASDATTRYGTGYPGGVIQVYTKARR
jgi:hypothetical protein